MAYEERNAWAGLIVTVIVMTAYVVVILQQAAGGPLADVVWWPTMLWTIGAGIAGTILLSIVWGSSPVRAIPTGWGSPTSATATSPGWAAASARRSRSSPASG